MKYSLANDVDVAIDVIDSHIHSFKKLDIQDCIKYVYRIAKCPLPDDANNILTFYEWEWYSNPLDEYDWIKDPHHLLEKPEFTFDSAKLSKYICDDSNIRIQLLAALLDNFAQPKFDLPLFDEAVLKLLSIDLQGNSSPLKSILKEIKNHFSKIPYVLDNHKSLTPAEYNSQYAMYYNPFLTNIDLINKLKEYIKNKNNHDIEDKIIAHTYLCIILNRCYCNPDMYINKTYDYNFLRYYISLQTTQLFANMEKYYNAPSYHQKIVLGNETFSAIKKKYVDPVYRHYFAYKTCKSFLQWSCKTFENLPGDSPVINSKYKPYLSQYKSSILKYNTGRNTIKFENEFMGIRKNRSSYADYYNPFLLKYKLLALRQGYVLPHCYKLKQLAKYTFLKDKPKSDLNKIYQNNIKDILDSLNITDINLSTQLTISNNWWKKCPYVTLKQKHLDAVNSSSLKPDSVKFIPPDNIKLTANEIKKYQGKRKNKKCEDTYCCNISPSSYGECTCECVFKIPLEKMLSPTEIAYILGFPIRNNKGKRSKWVIKIERLLQKNITGYAVQDIPNELYALWNTNIINMLDNGTISPQPLFNNETPANNISLYEPVITNGRLGFIANNYYVLFFRENILNALQKAGGLTKIFQADTFKKFERYHITEFCRSLKENTFFTKVWLGVPLNKFYNSLRKLNCTKNASPPGINIPAFPIFSRHEDVLNDELLSENFKLPF